MSRTAATLITGLAVGALTVLVYRRLQEVAQDEDPDAIMDRMSKKIAELENRVSNAKARAA